MVARGVRLAAVRPRVRVVRRAAATAVPAAHRLPDTQAAGAPAPGLRPCPAEPYHVPELRFLTLLPCPFSSFPLRVNVFPRSEHRRPPAAREAASSACGLRLHRRRR